MNINANRYMKVLPNEEKMTFAVKSFYLMTYTLSIQA